MVTERLGQTDRVEAALAEMDEQLPTRRFPGGPGG
jgi:hypothetical protein